MKLTNIRPDFYAGISASYKSINDDYQPSTYANSGSAIYNSTDGSQFATLASATAFKNLLEATLIQGQGQLIDELDGVLPHLVICKKDPNYIDVNVTSVEIPHRIASAWFYDSKMRIDKKTFETIFLEKVREVGVPAAVAYYCPNSLLHGYLFTAIKGLNTNVSKGLGMIMGGIRANNVVRIKNAGVSFDPLVVGAGDVKTINGEKVGNKLSSNATGNIVIDSSFLVTSNDVKVSLEIDYDGIDLLPVDTRVKQLLVNLANFQASKLLNRKIKVRVNTSLRPVNSDDMFKYPEEECLQALIESCEECKQAGLINPDVITAFDFKVS